MAALFPFPRFRAFTAAGLPLAGGKVYTYEAGTTTPKATYTDQGGATPNANPVILNANGEANIWLGVGEYKIELRDASDVVQWTVDDIAGNEIPADTLRSDIANTSSATLGDKLVGRKRTTTGAVATTEHDALEKERHNLNADYGIADDGSDQTTALTTLFSTFGTAFEGDLHHSIKTRYDLSAVINALPDKSVLHFATVKQTGSGYRQQLVGIADNPPTANTDTAFVVASTHYPDVVLNNLRSAGTSSATAGLSGFSWARGFYDNGSKGPRFQWQANFRKSTVRTSEYSGAGVGCFVVLTRAPERAGEYEEWFNGIVVSSGDYIVATNGYFYRATTSGTSTVSPTHTSGSATVGGVTWAFESAWVPFRTAFYVDELGRVGTNKCDTGYTQNWEQNPEDAEDFNAWWVAKGTSKRIRLRYQPTNSGGTNVTMPITDMTDTSGIRVLDSTLNTVFHKTTDANGFELGSHGRIQATATNGDTTPSVQGIGRLVLSNTGATTITNFDTFLPTQEVELYFTNSNTTLQHSSSLFLRGAVNVTPSNGQIIVITRDYINSGWVEKSRNF